MEQQKHLVEAIVTDKPIESKSLVEEILNAKVKEKLEEIKKEIQVG